VKRTWKAATSGCSDTPPQPYSPNNQFNPGSGAVSDGKTILAVDDSSSLRQMVAFGLKFGLPLMVEAVDSQDDSWAWGMPKMDWPGADRYACCRATPRRRSMLTTESSDG
jgi:hypothetical protein